MSDERCAWCGVDDPFDAPHDRLPSCPEIELRGGGLLGRQIMAEQMRAEIEVLRGIVQRVKDGYRVGREQFRGWWVTGEVSDGVGNFPLGRSPMSEAEQLAIYGSEVDALPDEDDDEASGKVLWRGKTMPPLNAKPGDELHRSCLAYADIDVPTYTEVAVVLTDTEDGQEA